MNLLKNLQERQMLLACLVCLIVLPTLLYYYPSQIAVFFAHYTPLDKQVAPQHNTEAEMLNDFVDFLRNQESHEIKNWSISGTLITPYTSTDLDALIYVDVLPQPRMRDTLQGEQRLCNQKNLPSKKS